MVSILDSFGISSIDFKGLLGTATSALIIAGVVILSAAFVYMLYRWKKGKDLGTKKEIYWWEEVGQRMVPVRIDIAEEVNVPGTHLKLFYVKKTNSWLPRFTRGISPNLFYVCITQNKEIVNFTLKSLESDMKEAGLVYDHTDMRWAAENLREFVKRNYKDKAVPWWREYQAVIATSIYILVMTFSMVIIIYFLKGIVGDIGAIGAQLSDGVEKLNLCSASGATINPVGG